MASASQHINPSIAPSIGEVSLAMTNRLLSASASHLERSGLPTTISMEETDRDSASRQVVFLVHVMKSSHFGTFCNLMSLETFQLAISCNYHRFIVLFPQVLDAPLGVNHME